MSEQERRQVKGWVPDTSQRTQKEIEDLDYILDNTGRVPGLPELPPMEVPFFPMPNRPKNLPEIGENKDKSIPLFPIVPSEDLE